MHDWITQITGPAEPSQFLLVPGLAPYLTVSRQLLYGTTTGSVCQINIHPRAK